MQQIRKDLILGAILSVLSLFLYFVMIPIGVDAPDTVQNPALSPRLWPEIIVVALGLLSLLVLLKSAVKLRGGAAEEPHELDLVEQAREQLGDAVDPSMEWQGRPGLIKTVIGVALLFALYALLVTLGMVVASVIATVVFAVLYGDKRWHLILPIAVILPLVLFAFFEYVASVPIPMGIFG